MPMPASVAPSLRADGSIFTRATAPLVAPQVRNRTINHKPKLQTKRPISDTSIRHLEETFQRPMLAKVTMEGENEDKGESKNWCGELRPLSFWDWTSVLTYTLQNQVGALVRKDGHNGHRNGTE